MSKEIKTYELSADGGNTKVKVIYKDKFTSYDNIYAKDSAIDYDAMNLTEEDMDENLRDVLNVRFTWHSGEADEIKQEFLFGELALNNKSDLDERVNADKSDDIMINMVTILSGVNFIIEEMGKKELKEELEFNLRLSTGLPYHEYKIRSLREQYGEHFKGNHIIENLDPRYPVKKITVHINDVIVKSEGMSALETIIKSKEVVTEETKDSVIDTVWSIIDIGGFTTDIVGGIFRQRKSGFKLETIDRLGVGKKYGISSAQNNAIANMISSYQSEGKVKSTFRITRKEINAAEMREGQYKGIINNKFNTNTTEFTSEEYKKLGRTIGNDFTQLFIQNEQMDRLRKIYIAGGGAYNKDVVDELISELTRRGFDKEIVEVVDSPNPVYVNAVGYYLDLQKEKEME